MLGTPMTVYAISEVNNVVPDIRDVPNMERSLLWAMKREFCSLAGLGCLQNSPVAAEIITFPLLDTISAA
jgi:hypothetical protein